ncbi:hypothetical protein N658DRAFT_461612 [Parathielavia hyrcaniae]|uniref:Synaptobrevin n=1 Tax=Parathielavia hyrcaniae TaxID=113614 RepID=A0AAN6QAQ4_9PEZI|nr:hypothetical protein N658DRAFT_461612 [Parathielavia hyrcaniae]
MGRLNHGDTATPMPRRADPLTDLSMLLNRLQRTILHADADREARLKESEFEREKAQANINYARSLLTKLEQDALTVKILVRRQEAQADLVRKRELLDQLSERLSDLAELAAAGGNGNGADEEDTSDGEDILADIIVTPSESMDSTRSTDMPPEEPDEPLAQAPDPLEPPSPLPSQHPQRQHTTPQPESSSIPSTAPPPTTTTSQTLRPRHPDPNTTTTPPPPPTTTATTTSSLFTNHPSQNPPTTATTTTTTATTTEEAILDHQRAEQDALSESILKLASDLKASSQAFSAALEEDKEVVERAGRGMSKTGEVMEGVTRRMGLLQRMTEGEGFWGRLRLYLFVYGLMVGMVLLVGVGPKLRF